MLTRKIIFRKKAARLLAILVLLISIGLLSSYAIAKRYYAVSMANDWGYYEYDWSKFNSSSISPVEHIVECAENFHILILIYKTFHNNEVPKQLDELRYLSVFDKYPINPYTGRAMQQMELQSSILPGNIIYIPFEESISLNSKVTTKRSNYVLLIRYSVKDPKSSIIERNKLEWTNSGFPDGIYDKFLVFTSGAIINYGDAKYEREDISDKRLVLVDK